MKNAVQLIVYPDSMGGNLKELSKILETHFADSFSGIHVLPFYPSAGDRGFSPLTYFEVEPTFGTWDDIKSLGAKYDIVADVMVNHISSQSEYFKNYLEQGENSPYKEFFISMEKIWDDGKIQQKDIDQMFLRRETPYSTYPSKAFGEKTLWTTFGRKTPSEQVDLDINAEDVKELFANIFTHLAENNINIVRLDAVGYVIKKVGTNCFFVEPEIWTFLEEMVTHAKEKGITLLPEVHAHYSIQYKLAKAGFWIYDFILPYKITEAIFTKNAKSLASYLKERPHNQFTMLDCHDGLPVKPDLDDLVSASEARKVVDICLERGASLSKIVSEKHKGEGGFDVHQIRGTYYSLLDLDDDAYIVARALQLFTPGIPQVYYVGLLAGENDFQRVEETGEGREINRHNFTREEIEDALEKKVVKRLMQLIRFRNEWDVFEGNFDVQIPTASEIQLSWEKEDTKATLTVDLCANSAIVTLVAPPVQLKKYIQDEEKEKIVL